MERGSLTSTENSTRHPMPPATGRGSRQRPPRRWLGVMLIVALVLLATGVLAWQFLISPQLSCSQATDPTRTGAVTEYCLPGNNRNYGAMTVGPDGNLWLTDSGKIARITPTGLLTEFAVAIDQPPLVELTPGPDGNIWFIDYGGDVGRITPTGVVTLFRTAEQANVGRTSIGTGPDGNVWFSAEPSTITRITPNGAMTRFTLPHDRDVTAITAGPDGGVWFLLVASDVVPFVISSTRIVRITP